MKAIYCELCGDIVAPFGEREPRDCHCGRHSVWWEDGSRGIIRVSCNLGAREEIEAFGGKPEGEPKVWILGITNALLSHPSHGPLSAEAVRDLIDAHPESYMFKTTRSLIVRFRPGQSSDSAWAAPPPHRDKRLEPPEFV